MRLNNFQNFNDFYPYYLQEHSNLTCRRLHFVGTCSVIALLLLFFFTAEPILLILIPVVGYGFSIVGHYFFERNKPCTLQHPIYSLLGDFRMFWEILSGRLKAF